MGYYLETPVLKNKAQYLIDTTSALLAPKDFTFDQLPADKAVVVVMNNGWMEAAGLAYNQREYDEFTNPFDERPKIILLMDREQTYFMAGYK